MLVAACARHARSGWCHGAAHRERRERRVLARTQTRRKVCVVAVQAAERGAARGRRLGERGAALKRRERDSQIGRRARRPFTG